MLMLKKENDARKELIVVLTFSIIFLAFSFSLWFVDDLYEFLKSYYEMRVTLFLVNVAFLALIFTIWITYRRWRMAAALKAELENIIDSIDPDVFLVVNPERKIVLTSSSIKRMFGYTEEEVIGKKTDLIYFDRRLSKTRTKEIYDSLKLNGFHVGFATGKKKDSTETIPLEIITGDLHSTPGAVILIRDMTYRETTEKALIEANQRLEKAFEDLRASQEISIQQERLAAIGYLATGIAHDFNNLLFGIGGYAELILHDPNISQFASRMLNNILEQNKKATQLVRQILDFSRKSIIAKTRMELLNFAKGIKKDFENTIPDNITFNLFGGFDEYWIDGDPNQLQQMFNNLFRNSVESMPNGGILVLKLERVTIRENEEKLIPDITPGEWVQISIVDTGSGIHPDVINHIFDPFFTTKDRKTGSGLGLSQVYGIVKQHDSFIDIQSEIGRGTSIAIFLPLSKAEEREIG